MGGKGGRAEEENLALSSPITPREEEGEEKEEEEEENLALSSPIMPEE